MKPSEWRWFKRRSAVEPVIGHMKTDNRMDRNYLKGADGDKINVILSAAGMNLAKLLNALAETPLRLAQLLVQAIQRLVTPRQASRPTTAPIRGRLVRSRSPPQPKTVMSLPIVSSLNALPTLISASGV